MKSAVVLLALIFIQPPVLAQDQKPGVLDSIELALAEVRENPASAEARFKLGKLYLDNLFDDKVLAPFEEAVRLKPDYIEALVLLGRVRYRKGLVLRAIQAYKKAIALDPQCVDAFLGLGDLYYNKHRIREAVESYRTAIQVNPDSAEAYLRLARTHLKTNHYGDAFNAFKGAIEVNPEALIYSDLYRLATESGRYDRAIELYKQALQSSPGNTEAHLYLAKSYERVKDYKESVEVLRQLVSLTPENPFFHFLLGVAYLKVGEKEAALGEYRMMEWIQVQMPEEDRLKKEVVGIDLKRLRELIEK